MSFQYDFKKLQQLLQDFFVLTGIKICVFDRGENEICFYPEKHTDFCRMLRQNKQLEERCRTCDTHAFAECRKRNAQYTYVCHAGLLECVSPIMLDEQLIGYLIIGQIKQTEQPLPGILSLFPDPEDKRLLREAYEKLGEIPPQKLQSAIRIMDACTGYEHLKALIQSESTGIDARLGNYIRKNLCHSLSVKELSEQFHLSHNEIYTIFKKHFDSTPAAYVKKSRMEHAAYLLPSTSLPICEIARACGIPDYNYFSKLFKKEYGCSPTVYRKRHFEDR